MPRKATVAQRINDYTARNPNATPKEISVALKMSLAQVYNTRYRMKKDLQALLQRMPRPTTTVDADPQSTTSAMQVQVGGDHYKKLAIQPVEYIHKNNIPFIEGCIIKYATRWKDKGGVHDLEKIKHFVDLLIEMENQ
jgi:hypothetical protein